MGKCVRKLYAGLGAGPENSDAKELLDAEGLRKFAEWFAMHLSNYNFVWRWPEWLVHSLPCYIVLMSETGRAISLYLLHIRNASLLAGCWRLK